MQKIPDPITPDKQCIFCSGGLEFLFKESLEEGFHYRCLVCKIDYKITATPTLGSITYQFQPISSDLPVEASPLQEESDSQLP